MKGGQQLSKEELGVIGKHILGEGDPPARASETKVVRLARDFSHSALAEKGSVDDSFQ